jgi:hypothetical protein
MISKGIHSTVHVKKWCSKLWLQWKDGSNREMLVPERFPTSCLFLAHAYFMCFLYRNLKNIATTTEELIKEYFVDWIIYWYINCRGNLLLNYINRWLYNEEDWGWMAYFTVTAQHLPGWAKE